MSYLVCLGHKGFSRKVLDELEADALNDLFTSDNSLKVWNLGDQSPQAFLKNIGLDENSTFVVLEEQLLTNRGYKISQQSVSETKLKNNNHEVLIEQLTVRDIFDIADLAIEQSNLRTHSQRRSGPKKCNIKVFFEWLMRRCGYPAKKN